MTCLPTSRAVVMAAAMVAFATGGAGAAGAAPTFDVDGYDACTATTVPAPGQDFDGVVATCCVGHAGVPAPTSYGMGCVAAVDDPTGDHRPTIVLPTRITPGGLNQQDGLDGLDGMIDEPVPEPLP